MALAYSVCSADATTTLRCLQGGIAGGVVAAALALAALIFCCCRWKSGARQQQSLNGAERGNGYIKASSSARSHPNVFCLIDRTGVFRSSQVWA